MGRMDVEPEDAPSAKGCCGAPLADKLAESAGGRATLLAAAIAGALFAGACAARACLEERRVVVSARARGMGRRGTRGPGARPRGLPAFVVSATRGR